MVLIPYTALVVSVEPENVNEMHQETCIFPSPKLFTSKQRHLNET